MSQPVGRTRLTWSNSALFNRVCLCVRVQKFKHSRCSLPDTCSEVSAPPCSDGAQAPDTEPPSHPSASAEVDLKDPNKYCALCAACFNNPHMALQHYNGRKHLRMEARQEVLKELGDDGCQGNMRSCLRDKLTNHSKVFLSEQRMYQRVQFGPST